MITGAATIHLEMYSLFRKSDSCMDQEIRNKGLDKLINPVVKALAIVIFIVRSLQDLFMIGLFIYLFGYFFIMK